MASSVVRFVPLCGAKSEDPLCYLLEIDDFKILLDCGWNEEYDVSLLEPLSRIAREIDAVFVSHGDLDHVGGLPYAYSKLGMQNARFYCTWPVYQMGHLTMSDSFHSHFSREDFPHFSIQDVDAVFGKFEHVRYNENMTLTGKGSGISATPYRSGHTIGGTIWRIRKDTEDIVYAVDYNHMKERHLDGATFDALAKPGVLITDTKNALEQLKMRKLRDAELIDSILVTLRQGGNVLMPIDSASRVLELALFLDATWQLQSFSYHLVLLSNVCTSLMHAARVMLEWTSEAIHRSFEIKRENPFEFKSVKLMSDLNSVLQLKGPVVVLASTEGLTTGFSLDLLALWASNSLNQVIFTQRSHKNSLARQLRNEKFTELKLKLKRKVLLEGEEKATFLRKEQEERRKRDVKDIGSGEFGLDDDDEEDEKDDEAQDKDDLFDGEDKDGDIELNGNGPRKKKHSVARQNHMDDSKKRGDMKSLEDLATVEDKHHRKKIGEKVLQHDIVSSTINKSGGYFKQTRQYTMFPVLERRVRFDDYGEVIRFEDYKLEDLEVEKDKKVDPLVEQEDKKAANEVLQLPTKSIVTETLVGCQCKFLFIDFEGLSDGRSKKTLLSQIAPRRIILVHGTEQETEAMKDYLLGSKELTKDIYAPTLNTAVDLSTALNVYQIKLTDALMTSLQFSKVNEYDLAYINGVMSVNMNEQLILDEIGEEKENIGHLPVLVGDPLLSDFRRLLQKEGFQADFAEGALVCNNTMAIRKTETGRLVMEGLLTEEYYQVRDLLYDQFAIL